MPDETILNTDTTTQTTAQLPNDPVIDIPGETPEQKYARLYLQQSTNTTGQQTPDAVAAALANVTRELEALRASQTQRPNGVAEPQVSRLEWVQKIQKGDFEGAQASLRDNIKNELTPQLESVRQQAYNDAMQAAWVNSEVEKYRSEVRTSNPELLPFEQYMQREVVERLRLAQAAGRVQTPAQFISEYHTAVNDEVNRMRNVVLSIRGQGKDEALLRSQQVLNSTTLTPQQVQSQQSQQLSQMTQNGENNDDYFARRRADENRRRGLA